ncbi:MAG: DoxX family membrane protein [Xanthobacteraceae bacterium]|nr:DoxX family membrane protein [Xanthobacteraceae bacterium]
MSAFVSAGRVLFAILFIVSGALHLFDLGGTTAVIAAKVATPAAVADYATQLEGVSGMPMARILAIVAGALELIGGVALAVNFGARLFAVLLILVTAAATFYFHDFWNQAWPGARADMVLTLKNLALIGGLLMIVGIGAAPRPVLQTEPGSETY